MNSTTKRIAWWEAEPDRLARDLREVLDQFPRLFPVHEGRDGWFGHLELWPFDRPQPAGLADLIGSDGLEVIVTYGAAYPMVPPKIEPVNVTPGFLAESQTAWHVLPGGALCLLRSYGAWDPATSINELLLKAAGWRIEFELMERGLIKAMSENGIVTDSGFDSLITAAADSAREAIDDGK